MAEGRDINLMPEDLRSKETETKSKKKDIFQVDLVVPEGSKAPKTKGGESFWSKLTKIFKRPPRFGSSIAKSDKKKEDKPAKDNKPKHKDKKNKDKQVDMPLHMPAQEDKSDKAAKIKYNEVKTDFKLPGNGDDDKEEKDKQPTGPSWWSKFWSKLFSKKDKQPKVTRVPEKPIKPRELPDHQVKGPMNKTDGINLIKDPEPAPKMAAPVTQPPAQEPRPTEPEIDTNVEDDTPKPDFSLPTENKPAEKKPDPKLAEPKKQDKKENKEEKGEGQTPKFHTPEPRIRARFLQDGGGVDLIPTAAKTRSWRQIINLVVVALVGSLLVLGIFYAVLFFQSKKAEQEKQYTAQRISDIEKKILEYEEINREINHLGQEIRLVNDLLTKHLYWTDFFALLEKYTISEVYYHGFSSGSGGSLTLQAVAPDFNSVARQLKVLEQDEAQEFISDVTILGASATGGGVEFDMILVLNENLFLHDSLEDVAAENNIENNNQ